MRGLHWVWWVVGILIMSVGLYGYSMYTKVAETATEVFQPLVRERSMQRPVGEEVSTAHSSPISILLVGADRRGEDAGRSDTLILMTLNPAESSMKLVSIPRDTYADIVGRGTKDKINHAYAFGGIDMAVATVESFLEVPVDYYVEVNMEGFTDIVNAVGGVDIHNDLEFTYEGYHFTKGPLHLDGAAALSYSRMRKLDPRGDFGRQMRQRQVIQDVLKKGASFSTLANYDAVLQSIRKNVKMNVTQEDMFTIQQNYKNCLQNREEIQIEGDGYIAEDGIWYYFVEEETRLALSQELRQHLGL